MTGLTQDELDAQFNIDRSEDRSPESNNSHLVRQFNIKEKLPPSNSITLSTLNINRVDPGKAHDESPEETHEHHHGDLKHYKEMQEFMEKMGMRDRENGAVMFYEDEYSAKQSKNGEEEVDYDIGMINELFDKQRRFSIKYKLEFPDHESIK